jgi:acyl-CoA reductase-like NAD-dependent aldehyde dehydrogenase
MTASALPRSEYGMPIDGETVTTGDWLDIVDPATAEVVGRLARGAAAEIDAAVEAAGRAAPEWGARHPAERGTLLRSLAQSIREHADELAELESIDTGKPLAQARADVGVAARYSEFYGATVEAYYGTMIPVGGAALALAEPMPFGVTGHIVPWNYPLQITTRSIAPSLAVGNAVVVKPAEDASLTAIRLAELALAVGFPAGTLNVVTGDGVAGAALAEHPDVMHVSFTGSVGTGRSVAVAAARRGRAALLELGGKAAQVVLPDADLELASATIVRTFLQNAGQTCTAATRAVVHRDVREEMVERLVAAVSEVAIGRGLDDPDMGPLISARQHERVSGFVERARDAGLTSRGDAPLPALDGFFHAPLIFENVPPDAEIAREEVFGPVLAVLAFEDEEEAIAVANGTEYGLTAAVWGRGGDATLRIARQLQVGQVYVNGYAAGGGVELPFGGVKASGVGREKGFDAMREFTETRTLFVSHG